MRVQEYGPAVDVWSMGCTLSEMLNGTPIWQGESDIDQLNQIQQSLSPVSSAAVVDLDQFSNSCLDRTMVSSQLEPKLVRQLSHIASPLALDALMGCLRVAPAARLSATQLLQHEFFVESVPACNSLRLLSDEYSAHREASEQQQAESLDELHTFQESIEERLSRSRRLKATRAARASENGQAHLQ